MKYYKIEASRLAPRYEITNAKSFEAVTSGKYPFIQVSEKSELRQYAICPSCLNSIQIVGLYKAERTYGKHTGKQIKGFPIWNYDKYVYCPYATQQKASIEPTKRLFEVDDSVRDIYSLLKTQFDRVVYIIEKTIGIRCSNAFWENALQQFIASESYLYPWITESNLPYIFAYFGLQQKSLYNQRIKVDSEIYHILCNIKGVNLKESNDEEYKYLNVEKGRFLSITFRFIEHKQSAKSGEELKESITMYIDCNNSEVYNREIIFDESYFLNIINSENNDNKRRTKLLEKVNDIMNEI